MDRSARGHRGDARGGHQYDGHCRNGSPSLYIDAFLITRYTFCMGIILINCPAVNHLRILTYKRPIGKINTRYHPAVKKPLDKPDEWMYNILRCRGKTAATAAIEYLGVAQFGSVLEWGSRGREFKSLHPDHGKSLKSLRFQAFSYPFDRPKV